MIAKVTKDSVVITDYTKVYEGEFCVNSCEFILPDCFSGLTVVAAFNNIPVPLTESQCIIPRLKKGNAVLGVYAYRESDGAVELMYSPKPTVFYVDDGSYTEKIAVAETPDISTYEEYCIMINAIGETLLTRANSGEFNGEGVPPGGVDGALLIKGSSSDYDTLWSDYEASALESNGNKVTELSDAATDTQYPSAKCVYDLVEELNTGINLCELSSNKVTSIDENSTDTQYPSAKIVYDSLESIKSFTQLDPTELLLIENLEEGAYRIRCTNGYGVRIYAGEIVTDTFTAKDGILYVSKTGLSGSVKWTFFGGGIAGISSPPSIGIWSGVVSVSGTGAVSCTINNYETNSNRVDEMTDLTIASKYPSVGAVRDYVSSKIQAALYVDSEAVV